MKPILETLGKLAVLMPLAHIIACSIFFGGYTWGFGGNVSTLFSFTDLFEMSFSGLITIYGLGVLMPAIIIALRNQSPNLWPLGDVTTEQKKTIISMTDYATIIVTLIIGVETVAALILKRMVPYTLLPVPLILFFSQRSAAFFGEHGISQVLSDCIWVAAVFVLMALSTGYARGDVDRRESFEFAADDSFACNDLVVLKKASNDYIAVRRDGRRIVIDDKCKTLFEFPKTRTYQW